MIAPTSGAITTAEGLVKALKQSPADIAFLVPSIVKELSHDMDLLDYCANNLECIIYCGGDLPRSIGDLVASKVRLLNQFGATEIGLTPNLLKMENRALEDWKYAQFHPDLGIEFRHVSEGMHELYVVRDSSKEGKQPTFTLFPHLQEYGSRDLFIRHPSKEKPEMWAWCARADDIIVFLNGEKTNPISMEQYIAANNQDIAAVLVMGAQRFQAALLIEPTANVELSTTMDRARFLEKIWAIIEAANMDAPAHARITKAHVLFTHPDKPMLRAGKGTIQRRGTLSLYANDIDALYADAEEESVAGDSPNGLLVNYPNVDTVSRVIREIVLTSTKWKEIDDMDDFFSLGMDSLQALTILREIKRGLGYSGIALSTIYTNSTISSLVKAILRLRDGQHETHEAGQAKLRLLQVNILQEYKTLIDQLPRPTTTIKKPSQETVILTGSTGALGSYILESLLINPAVSRVYCFNRTPDSEPLHISRNRNRGLYSQLPSAKAVFVTVDLTRADLGISQELLENLKQCVTSVVHNAWPVNFNLSLQSFRPQLDGLVNLMGFMTSAATSPVLFFVSSISSVMCHRNPSERIPEMVIYDETAPGLNGYAQSKYVAELLLEHARYTIPLRTCFARVGQIAGSVNHPGLWNKAEWFPSLVISSLHLGAIPDSIGSRFGKIDWVPIDHLAGILTDLALNGSQRHRSRADREEADDIESSQEKDMQVFHPLNPYSVGWEYVRIILVEELSRALKRPVEVLPLQAWLQKVRKDSEVAARNFEDQSNGELEEYVKLNPAVKLLDFYEKSLGPQDHDGSELEIGWTLQRSEKLRMLEGVNAGWIGKWVREWLASM